MQYESKPIKNIQIKVAQCIVKSIVVVYIYKSFDKDNHTSIGVLSTKFETNSLYLVK